MPMWPARRDHLSITERPHPLRPANGAVAAADGGGPAGAVDGRPGPSCTWPPPATDGRSNADASPGQGAAEWRARLATPVPRADEALPPAPGGQGWRGPPRHGHGRYGPGLGWDQHPRGPRRFHPRGPWRRSLDDRIFAGVAGGVGRRFGVDATVVRIGFAIATLAGGWGLPLYMGAWLLMPLDGRDESIGSRVVRDRQGMLLALAFVPALVVAMVVASVLHLGFVSSVAWSVFLFGAGAVLLWRNSDPEERAWLREAADPVMHWGSRSSRSWRRMGLRIALGVLLLVAGIGWLAARHSNHSSPLRSLEAALLVAAAALVLFGPWWLRLLRDLISERQARQRAEDRADMAARVHDSVLQTLAMIQRASEDPQRVVQLARSQERELRAWLFEGDIPPAVGDQVQSIAAGTQLIATEVEERHGVPVDVVTVGDCPLDDGLRSLLDAAREAAVNAAKWSGAPTISLFSEVEPARVSVFVRDRGVGFDPDAVASDRHGIAESIQARMLRHGGRAELRTAPGEGTEVELVMPRSSAR
jgi:signal transduction histidine kinase/phage shock protein PspC (stress-responsive transcriptional regulator)